SVDRSRQGRSEPPLQRLPGEREQRLRSRLPARDGPSQLLLDGLAPVHGLHLSRFRQPEKRVHRRRMSLIRRDQLRNPKSEIRNLLYYRSMPWIQELQALEDALRSLNAQYDAFLFGSTSRPPVEIRRKVATQIRRLSTSEPDSPAERYRFSTLQ